MQENIQDLMNQINGSDKQKVPSPFSKKIKLVKENNVAKFQYYDKETTSNKILEETTLDGVIIDNAMQLSVFDPSFGGNGGEWYSKFYFSKESVVLFNPKGKMEKEGTMADIEKFITEKGMGKPKKRVHLFFLTEKYGLLDIASHAGLTFSMLEKVKNYKKQIISLKASVYNKLDPDISKKTVDSMGSLANANPPLYVKLTPVSENITTSFIEKSDILNKLKNYIDYKNSLSNKAYVPDIKISELKESNSNNNAEIVDDLPF